ncbi:MAG: MOSC domain-containing protein [bacterium]
MGKVVSVNVSERKHVKKKPVAEVILRENFGVEGDSHAETASERQVSLLAVESIEKMRNRGLDVGPGDFAENITTEGIPLPRLPVGTRLICGEAVLQVTRIGKDCHEPCAIFRQAGECVMPSEGIFARVLAGGAVRPGDPVETGA